LLLLFWSADEEDESDTAAEADGVDEAGGWSDNAEADAVGVGWAVLGCKAALALSFCGVGDDCKFGSVLAAGVLGCISGAVGLLTGAGPGVVTAGTGFLASSVGLAFVISGAVGLGSSASASVFDFGIGVNDGIDGLSLTLASDGVEAVGLEAGAGAEGSG
jgi:hypothetical protein